jgi:nucleotide-binding universal stress UspA family protein
MFKTILCPVDGSDHANKALELAIDLAKAGDAKLILLHGLLLHEHSDDLKRFAEVEGLTKTVEPGLAKLRSVEGRLEYGYEEPASNSRMYVEIGQTILDNAKSDAEEAGVQNIDTILTGGDPARQALRCAEEQGVDCIVMGSRGLSDMKALFLGSVSHKILNRAPCTCIAVK